LRKLSFHNISQELKRVQNEAQASRRAKRSAPTDVHHDLAKLTEMYAAWLPNIDGPINAKVLRRAVESAKKAKVLGVDHAILSFSARSNRISVLLHCLSLGAWLRNHFFVRQDKFFDMNVNDVSEEELWLYRLCKDVTNYVNLRRDSQTFVTSAYGVLDSISPRHYTVKRPHPLQIEEGTARQMAKSIVLEVVLAWIECDIDLWRLWAVNIVVFRLGFSAIVLEGTWDMCMESTGHAIFKNYRRNKHSFEIPDLIDFDKALMMMAKTAEWRRSFSYSQGIYNIVVDINSPSGRIRDPGESARMFFLNYVREALEVFPHGIIATNEATEDQRNIMNDPDRFLPFRECTPSLARMRGPGGPYHKDTPRTTAGLFSSIIWRTVTFRSQFADIDKMVFHDLDDWRQATSTSEGHYVCLGNQYGSGCKKNTDQVPQYWKSVLELDWETRLKEHPEQSFMDVFYLLHPPRGKKPFPQLGALGAFHVVSDLALCKIIPRADNRDVGICMSTIDAGSASGAEFILGSEKQKKISPERCSEGAKLAFETLNTSLTEEEKKMIGLDDGSVIEHMLCKFSRAWKKIK
jgi:hypothetical protein